MISRLHRLVERIAALVCRHQKGTICAHRQWTYDHWYRGYLAGLTSGKENVEAKWAGSITNEGPYAGYPPPVHRTITATVLALVAILALSLTALAGSPHEVGQTSVTVSGNTITVSGKIAGLGNETQVHVELTADAECVNRGGHNPSAANKTSVTAEGDFPVQNGKALFTLTATASFQPDCSPPMSVTFSNVSVIDTTHNLVLVP